MKLKDVIYNQLLKEESGRRSGKGYKRDKFYPSEFGKCKREVYYDFKGAPKDAQDGRTLLTFRIGDAVHNIIKTILYNAKIMTADEVKVFDADTNTSGRFDGGVLNSATSKQELIEIKSTNHFSFEAMDEIELADDKYRGQLVVYMHSGVRNVGNVLVINKNTSEIKEWELPLESAEAFYAEKVKPYFDACAKVIKKRTPPVREYTREDWQCQYCSFRTKCWEGVPLPEAPKFEPKADAVKPGEEILAASVVTYARLKAQIKDLENELESAESVVKQWFDATAEEALTNSGVTIKRVKRTESEWDIDFIKSKLTPEVYAKLLRFDAKLLQAEVKAKAIDPVILETAKKIKLAGYSLKLEKPGKAASEKEAT